jgi:hypothetical protein
VPANIEILDWAVLRVAAWPIEITERFAAPQLAESARRVLAAERQILARRQETLAILEKAVPIVSGRRARAWLLAVKRLIYNGWETFPEPPADVTAQIGAVPGLTHRLGSERTGRSRYAAGLAELDMTHDAELDRQRAALASITAEARFARALALANPVVAREWRRRHPTSPTTARQRRLETTVFRYLMRAIGRATPQGAWAGVTPVAPDGTHGVGTRVVPARRHYTANVDLTPFATAAAVLSRQDRYQRGYPLRVNPTLHAHAGTWWYESGSDWVTVPDHQLIAVLLDIYRDGEPHHAEPLLDTLASVSSTPELLRPMFGRALDLLLERDILRSALEFPNLATDPDQALRMFVRQLVQPDRTLWESVAGSMGRLCAFLADGFDHLPPDEIGALVERLRLEISRIMKSVGLDLAPDVPVLRLDMAAPFSVTWTAEVRGAVRDCARNMFELLAATGAAERFRAESVGRLVRAAPDLTDVEGIPLVELFHLMRGADTAPPTAAIPRSPVPGPAGTLVFTIGGERFTVDWGRPQPAIFAARFGELLGGPKGGVISALRALARSWSGAGASPVEIVGTDPLNRNAALRQDLTPHRLCAHAPEAARLTVRVENGRPWLHGPAGRLLPVYSSAAFIGSTDPCSRVLYTLAMGHGWELISDGSSPQRWTIDGPTVDELRAHQGSARYLAWRRVVERLELPALVWVGRTVKPDARLILVRTDSPLAVACLLRGNDSTPNGLVLTALPGDPSSWPVRDEAGNHYLAELAATWYDEGYLAAVIAAAE